MAQPLSLNSNPWIDISMSVNPQMHYWPDNPPFRIESSQSIKCCGVCNVSEIHTGTHTGTHVDGLRHFIEDADGIDAMPVDRLIGLARVVEVNSEKEIRLCDFDTDCINKGDRIIFKSRNSVERIHARDSFQKDFVHLSVELAEWLVDMECPCVGVDYLSVGGFEGNVEKVHHILLGSGLYAVEGLVLSDVDPGWYNFICLPIRLENGDAGLARAILQKTKK